MNILLYGYILYAFATIYELVLLSFRTSKHMRQALGMLCLLLTSASHALIVSNEPLLFGLPFLCIGLYRMVNIMRFSYSRMHTDYLYKTTARTSFVLGILQAFVGIIAFYSAKSAALLQVIGYGIAMSVLFLLITALYTLISQLKNSRMSVLTSFASDDELPSVTVAIPARNETTELADCIRSFVASDYKKLEILVLDDCSQDKTSDIIKKFAHEGVRFIQGSEPGDTWLAKNAAYNKLASEATGEYLLFCGVDVRVRTDTIKQLMTRVVQQELDMVSVLPARAGTAHTASFAQMIRYIWELCILRVLLKRPPVLSTAWLIKADALHAYGGIAAVKRKIVPESFFARALSRKNTYRFWRANEECSIESHKTIKAQQQTAIRVRYPQLHKRPENVAILTVAELAMLSAPGIAYILWQNSPLFMLVYTAVLGMLLVLIAGILAAAITKNHRMWYAVQALFAVPIDIWLTHVSLWRYEFARVDWKERNVCLPVMHVIPHLPVLDDSTTVQDQEPK